MHEEDDDEHRLTTKRAKEDPVIGPFIETAKEELTYHARFKIESLVKALNLQFYRKELYRRMPRIVRIIAKDLNCKLEPYAAQNMRGEFILAGLNAGRAVGYCKVGKEYAALADKANSMRVARTGGIARQHNNTATVLEAETGEKRDHLHVQVGKIAPPSPTQRLAKSFVDALRGDKE